MLQTFTNKNIYELLLCGYQIHIATVEYQNRTHHKKRINKKWRKRYGITEINMMPDDQIIFMNNMYFMNKKMYNKLKENLNG